MADLSITAASVVRGTDSQQPDQMTAGATITAGQAVYKDTSDNDKAKLADNDDTSAKATAWGIALNGAASGQPVLVHRQGPITIGATLTVGETYVLSSTAGGICPIGDLGTGDYVTHLGIATSTSSLAVKIHASGTQKP